MKKELFATIKEVVLLFFCMSLFACGSRKASKSTASSGTNHYTITDTALDTRMIRMPYNRLIDPAGTIVRFGSPELENHALDCVLLPGSNVLAVEDRYGVAFINISNNKLLYHISYDEDSLYEDLISTYS